MNLIADCVRECGQIPQQPPLL